MIKTLTTFWSRTVDATSQRAYNDRAIRELLRLVVYASLLAIIYALYETISLIKMGKIDVVTGTLLGGIFTLFSTILSVAVPAFINALKDPTPVVPVNTNTQVNKEPPKGEAG
jgi:hypothetical protein